MHVFKFVITLISGLFLYTSLFSQSDSCKLKVSLLTCGPGEDLYSLFGHTAIRVTDQSAGTDIIYNYGTFDFEDPDFYVKFVRGKLLYSVSYESYDKFAYSYQLENRTITEQKLRLTCGEREKLYAALRTNSLEQNRYYKYQYLHDNCSTRPRDIIAGNTDDRVFFKTIVPDPAPTFREMIHIYLDSAKQYWSGFGIDLLLASRIDKSVTNQQAMFLPEFLMKGFDSAVLRSAPIVSVKRIILHNKKNEDPGDVGFMVTPMMVTLFLLSFGLLITFTKNKKAERIRDIFDISYFFILGFVGFFILFMWFGTEHELCRDNYNLLWALPTHLIIVFFSRNNALVRKYFAVTAIICVLLVLTWSFLPQGMNAAFLPLVLLSGVRSAYRAMKK